MSKPCEIKSVTAAITSNMRSVPLSAGLLWLQKAPPVGETRDEIGLLNSRLPETMAKMLRRTRSTDVVCAPPPTEKPQPTSIIGTAMAPPASNIQPIKGRDAVVGDLMDAGSSRGARAMTVIPVTGNNAPSNAQRTIG